MNKKPRPNSPCKGCKDRNAECHSVCEKYLGFRKELDEWNYLDRQIHQGIMASYHDTWTSMSSIEKAKNKREKHNG